VQNAQLLPVNNLDLCPLKLAKVSNNNYNTLNRGKRGNVDKDSLLFTLEKHA
jgi:hypothetical protein